MNAGYACVARAHLDRVELTTDGLLWYTHDVPACPGHVMKLTEARR